MAAIYDRFMRESEQACLVGWREELLAGGNGEVLEIGAGTGGNLPHYPEGGTRLVRGGAWGAGADRASVEATGGQLPSDAADRRGALPRRLRGGAGDRREHAQGD